MTAKTSFSALVVTLLALTRAQAQGPSPLPPPAPVHSVIVEGDGLSDWITYCRGGYCMGPIGRHGPIASEVYLRAGPDFPVGGNLGDILNTGFIVQGGGRALLFNAPETAAWTIDVGLTNINNGADGADAPFVITQPGAATVVHIRSLNRTFFNVGFGRQWYPAGANAHGRIWTFGLDGGGRYGSASVELVEIRHRTDVIGGVYGAGFAGIEFPIREGFFHAGVRSEFSYTWSDIMQTSSDTADVGVMLNLGLRF